MDPLHYLRLLRRKWRVIALVTVLGAIVGWVTTPSAEAQVDNRDYYRATHTLIAEADASGATSNLAQLALLLTVGDVPQRVAEELGGEPEVLASQVDVNVNPTVGTLDITTLGTDGQRTADLADAFADALLVSLGDRSQTQRAEAQAALAVRLDDVEDRLADLEAQIDAGADELVVAQRDALVREYGILFEDFQSLARSDAPSAGLRTLQPATAVPISGDAFIDALRAATGGAGSGAAEDDEPGEDVDDELEAAFDAGPPEPPSPVQRALLGGGLGLFASLAAILLMDRLDNRLRTKEEAEDAFGLPVVAEIPVLARKDRRRSEVVSALRPRSRIAEAYRGLRTAVQYMQVVVPLDPVDGERFARPDRSEGDGMVVLVTSPGPAEGKTTSVVNLAAAYAEGGASVLVVDGDFRRPAVHHFLEDRSSGSEVSDASAGLIAECSIPGISAITHLDDRLDAQQPADLLAWIRATVERARGYVDVVIIDTAPFLNVNDARDLLNVSDLVVVIARAGKTTRQSADRMSEILSRLGARVVGVVLVGAADTPTTKRYYYSKDPGSEPVEPGARRRLRNRNGDAPVVDDDAVPVDAVDR